MSPLKLLREAEYESYTYFDAHIRPLPKTASGEIDTFQPGFQDNDVDAFRHAYVSGIFTHEYGEKVALILGWMNEFVFPSTIYDRNMDIWNNEIGRKLAKQNKSKQALAAAIQNALNKGHLIVNPSDTRTYKGAVRPRPDEQHSVITIEKSASGSNELFFDFANSKVMTRSEFIDAIAEGHYPYYEIRTINGTQVPASKRDDSSSNNLG